jgi:hypothetical protein
MLFWVIEPQEADPSAPPASRRNASSMSIQDIAVIDKGQFRDAGPGRLAVVLSGEVQISEKQIQPLRRQLKRPAPLQ